MAGTTSFGDADLQHGALTNKILKNFYEVYNELGRGFLESVYQTCLARALSSVGLHVEAQVPIDVFFRGDVVGRFYADLVVEHRVVIEVKALRTLQPAHEAQLRHYLRATAMEVGLLLNFGVAPEIKRVIYSNDIKQPR